MLHITRYTYIQVYYMQQISATYKSGLFAEPAGLSDSEIWIRDNELVDVKFGLTAYSLPKGALYRGHVCP